MQDVRGLVPRTPPEGLLEWAAERLPGLDRDGLLLETVWAEDWSLETILDEWARGKKVRAVRATCSACTETGLLWRGRDNRGNYGFIHPESWAMGEGGSVYSDGDETTCPFCGDKVTVRTKSKLRGKGYFVAADESVTSACVAGRDKLLALTCWRIERRIYSNARRALCAIPAECYVFGPDDCAQLMGWTNGYSGNGGYFIQYTSKWRQPKEWKERWGRADEVYGLTPELIEESCLPHCKLDQYMDARGPGCERYPVAYLRLYQAHPNVEHVLMHGLPRVLDDLLSEHVNTQKWIDENRRGQVELPEILWKERRPAQMLGLTKEELRTGRERDWGSLLWRLFTRSKAAGEMLTDSDIVNAFSLGDEHVVDLVGRGPVAKSIRYLLHQIEHFGVEPEDEDPDPNFVLDVQILLDYWDMCIETGRDLSDPGVRFPADLLAAHDTMAELAAAQQAKNLTAKFRLRRRQLARFSFQADGLMIRPAGSQEELTREGDKLHHCVATYGKKHANGKTAIFFIRRRKEPHIPFYTLELSEDSLTVCQNRGLRNCGRTPEVKAFEELWSSWLKVGAPRDVRGRPIMANEINHEALKEKKKSNAA